MKAYVSFFRMRLLAGMQYRAAALGGIVTQFFWGFMEVLLYKAFYEAAPDQFPMLFEHLVSYIWLRQALLMLLNTWVFDNELFAKVLDGSVAYELCRPASLYGMWYARTMALRVSRVILRCVPLLAVTILLPSPWGLNAPASPLAFGCFVVSLGLSACVAVAFSMILYFSCFYTTSSEGIRFLLMPVSELLSGSLIPLPFLPDGLARIFHYSPFGSMANAPLRIYSGDLSGGAMAEMLCLQLFWLLVMGAFGWLLQKRGLRKLCVQGG